jgi:hypothetical protein
MTLALEGYARRALPWLVAAALITSWWFSLIILLDTPLVDLTPPKIVVLFGAAVLSAARPWRVLSLREWRALLPVGAYLAWFPLAALLRATSEDLKTAAAYLVFCGLAAALSFAAVRLERQRAARMLVLVVLGAVFVSFFAAVLERATYPMPGEADPLAWLWSLFRPQTGLADPRLGDIPAPPLHAGTGQPGVVRATGFFVQTNYLAFFAVLAVPLLMIMLVRSMRKGRRMSTLFAAAALSTALVTAYWTYARVGIVAVGLVAVAALAVEFLSETERRAFRPSVGQLKPTLLGLAVAAVVMAGSLLSDGVGLSRFSGESLGEAPITGEQSRPPPEPVGESATRSANLRLALQQTALDMVTADAGTMLIGPGLAAYETAIHDPASLRHLPAAFGIRDPNSLWLTVSLAGGVPGLLLLALLVGYLMVRLARAIRRPDDGWPRLAVLWLAAWLPVWAVIQFLGTNPFNTSESIIFGTLVGSMVGLTEPGAGAAAGARSGDVEKA